ncbi:type IV pilus modification protein PilV [Diaphorobacter caeni]|uniref:type IV pilus modification protein PilV n=1 Tax=Diaphorobacter caeni TaxID=2784387 RepID=UPI00188DF35D|nr:type IV pilus modification protein PilV [Diaphorobacter caeni]MBF5005273.1 type IV pilus modification protein PilV [Diaphorobacter caeni]
MLHRPFVRGITLIESLIAILVMALGVFSVLGIQLRTLSDAQAGIRRSQAIRLIADLSERIKSNPAAIEYLDIYTEDSPPQPTDDCSASCTAASLARLDSYQWHQQVHFTLGSGRAAIFRSNADGDSQNPLQLGVMIAWKETERLGQDSQTTEALNAFLQISAADASGQICPEQYVCHLQYISIPGGCRSSDKAGESCE